MKKILLILPFILILTACSSKPAEIQKDFKASVISEYNGVKLKAEICSDSHDILTVKMKAPKSIDGYTYEFKSLKVKVKYKDLVLKAESGYINKNSFVSVIYNVFKAVNHDKAEYAGTKDNKAIYKGKCESGNFTITSDFSTGYISEIELKEPGIKAKFKIIS